MIGDLFARLIQTTNRWGIGACLLVGLGCSGKLDLIDGQLTATDGAVLVEASVHVDAAVQPETSVFEAGPDAASCDSHSDVYAVGDCKWYFNWWVWDGKQQPTGPGIPIGRVVLAVTTSAA